MRRGRDISSSDSNLGERFLCKSREADAEFVSDRLSSPLTVRSARAAASRCIRIVNLTNIARRVGGCSKVMSGQRSIRSASGVLAGFGGINCKDRAR
jgi:hypothetical protein